MPYTLLNFAWNCLHHQIRNSTYYDEKSSRNDTKTNSNKSTPDWVNIVARLREWGKRWQMFQRKSQKCMLSLLKRVKIMRLLPIIYTNIPKWRYFSPLGQSFIARMVLQFFKHFTNRGRNPDEYEINKISSSVAFISEAK